MKQLRSMVAVHNECWQHMIQGSAKKKSKQAKPEGMMKYRDHADDEVYQSGLLLQAVGQQVEDGDGGISTQYACQMGNMCARCTLQPVQQPGLACTL
jgi:hypothetical protein